MVACKFLLYSNKKEQEENEHLNAYDNVLGLSRLGWSHDQPRRLNMGQNLLIYLNTQLLKRARKHDLCLAKPCKVYVVYSICRLPNFS
jgi:hypothetical protein